MTASANLQAKVSLTFKFDSTFSGAQSVFCGTDCIPQVPSIFPPVWAWLLGPYRSISGKKLENKPVKLGAGEKGRSDEVNGQGQLLQSTQEPPGVTNQGVIRDQLGFKLLSAVRKTGWKRLKSAKHVRETSTAFCHHLSFLLKINSSTFKDMLFIYLQFLHSPADKLKPYLIYSSDSVSK